MKKLLAACLLCLGFVLAAEPVAVSPANAEIVLPPDAGGMAKVAALELQKHLKIITGMEIPVNEQASAGQYTFLFSGVPAGKTLKPEEAVWKTQKDSTVFYGDDTPSRRDASVSSIIFVEQKSGTLTAVYDFLEKQFGVRWLWPGDGGIVAPHSDDLRLNTGEGNWTPELEERHIGPGYGMWKWARYEQAAKNLPKEFRLDKPQYEAKALDTFFWLRRMRMGKSVNYKLGHAFTDWWAKYGKSHPEYFALQPDGVRRPQNPKWPHSVKLCVSNPAVVKQVVENWRQAGMPSSINTCENDSRGYCRCLECLKLDVVLPGEKTLSELKPEEEGKAMLTDRYVHFANAVLAEAAKYRPDVVATMYAYSCYSEPPRREKVSPGVVVGFVPFMMNPFDVTDTHWQKWREAGAKLLLLRPNDQHVNTGLPMGFEKRLYDHFHLGVENGIFATSYDSLHNYWQATGVADYVLARAHASPSASFDSLMDEYCSAFGAAAPEMREYFDYWRVNVFESKIMKDAKKIREVGKYGNFRRGLMWSLKNYYSVADFDRTDALLARGAQKELTEPQRGLLEKYRLANRHARMMFEAVSAKDLKRVQNGTALFRFRVANRDALDMDWARLISSEYDFGDICGIREGLNLVDYADSAETSFRWNFRLDPQDVGEKERWQEKPFEEIKSWDLLRVDLPWERQPANIIPPQLFEQLKNYDGIGWYGTRLRVKPEWKGREIFLLFGLVDESAWVWLNGKFCGKRVYESGDEWSKPFAIPITEAIDWKKPYQTVVVRVMDIGGLGGICKRPYLVVSDKK